MPATDDLVLLTRAAEAAAEIALKYFRADPKVWDKGSDDPVTEADLAVDTYLRDTLTAARPGYGWLSEETADSPDRLSRDKVFIVDPIDGTRAFIKGEGTWSHSLAVSENGRITAGVVLLPARERLFAAAHGQGATLNGARLAASDGPLSPETTVLASRAAFRPEHWRAEPPEITRKFRPSLAYRLGLVGSGKYDVMLSLRPTWEWDIAAGALIATEAGAMVTDRAGQPHRFNAPTPRHDGVVAAGPGRHATLIESLATPA